MLTIPFFERIIKFLGDFVAERVKKGRPSEAIQLKSDGFVMRRDDRIIAELRWDDIGEIVAFKRDLIGVDLICLEFRLKSQRDIVFEANEEVPGYDLLVKELERVFPTMDRGWWEAVAKPAFSKNTTVIYKSL
jgi:hypothetical protein